MRTVLLVCGFFFLPMVSSAAVTISEVAWMGTTASANDEWIELYNDGGAEMVDGWTLSDGMNLEIPLTGTISGGAFAVLERTDDDTAPGAAFLLYTGALVNTGATLTLRDAAGAIVDQVAGGDNWQTIGGDNVTKETAQYTPSGWVTGTPTPGASNVSVGSAPVIDEAEIEDDEDGTAASTESTKKTNRASASETIKLVLPGITLALAIDAQSIAYVNQPLTFRAEPSGIGEMLIHSLAYDWNFGDGEVGSQKEVTHAFAYPGTYVVTLHAAYARQWQVARHEITVLPVTFTVATTPAGDVQLHNNANYDVDISGYQVFGERRFTFPPRSIMVPKATITLPQEKIGVSEATIVRLHDQAGALVASTVESLPVAGIGRQVAVADGGGAAATAVAAAPPPPRPVAARTVLSESTSTLLTAFMVPEPTLETVASATSLPTPSTATPTLTAATFDSGAPVATDRLWYAGFIILSGLGIMIYLTTGSRRTSSTSS